jgi:hypothetical protein
MGGEPFYRGPLQYFDTAVGYRRRLREIEIERACFILGAKATGDQRVFQCRVIVGADPEVGWQTMGAVDGFAVTNLFGQPVTAGTDDVHGIGAARVAFGQADQPAIVKDFLQRRPRVQARFFDAGANSIHVHGGLR